MKLYIHNSNSREIREASVENGTTIGALIKQYAGADASNPDHEEDLEVRFENKADELSKDVTMEKLKVKGGEHLNFSRCKKVAVSIQYHSESYSHSYPPSITVAEIKKDALKHFKIGALDGSELSLFLTSNADDPIPVETHIGSLTGYPGCSVQLFLSKRKAIQG